MIKEYDKAKMTLAMTKQPTVAIITYLFCEKFAIDTMMDGPKQTFLVLGTGLILFNFITFVSFLVLIYVYIYIYIYIYLYIYIYIVIKRIAYI